MEVAGEGLNRTPGRVREVVVAKEGAVEMRPFQWKPKRPGSFEGTHTSTKLPSRMNSRFFDSSAWVPRTMWANSLSAIRQRSSREVTAGC
jgi:hypothetical protein